MPAALVPAAALAGALALVPAAALVLAAWAAEHAAIEAVQDPQKSTLVVFKVQVRLPIR